MRDIDIRQTLLPDLESQYQDDKNTLIVEELGLCQGTSRIDIAVVNGSIHGYEIKSEKDTLCRLEAQRDAYNKVFDYITIVASPRHLKKITKLVPDWWGIDEVIEQNKKPSTRTIRPCTKNPEVDPFTLVQLLWRDEALTFLRSINLHKGITNKPRRVLWERLAENLSLHELSAAIRDIIRKRKNWRAA